MARPISMDLRERAMERLDRGQTVREVAAALEVGAVERGEVVAAAAQDRQLRSGQARRQASPEDLR